MDGCGQVESTDRGQTMPQIGRLNSARDHDDIVLHLVVCWVDPLADPLAPGLPTGDSDSGSDGPGSPGQGPWLTPQTVLRQCGEYGLAADDEHVAVAADR
jgi:hypothetical protein